MKLFKTLTARVLSSLNILGLRPRIFKLDKTPLFVFQTPLGVGVVLDNDIYFKITISTCDEIYFISQLLLVVSYLIISRPAEIMH